MRKQVGWGQLTSSIDAPRGAESSVIAINQKQVFAILLYCLEFRPLAKHDLNLLDFIINRIFMKLFKTCDINIVKTKNL